MNEVVITRQVLDNTEKFELSPFPKPNSPRGRLHAVSKAPNKFPADDLMIALTLGLGVHLWDRGCIVIEDPCYILAMRHSASVSETVASPVGRGQFKMRCGCAHLHIPSALSVLGLDQLLPSRSPGSEALPARVLLHSPSTRPLCPLRCLLCT